MAADPFCLEQQTPQTNSAQTQRNRIMQALATIGPCTTAELVRWLDCPRPGEFMRNKQTRAMVKEIETAEIPAVKAHEGVAGGTFVAKELVYAYAMWTGYEWTTEGTPQAWASVMRETLGVEGHHHV